MIKPMRDSKKTAFRCAKKVILVASGKGGVGKSTVTTNLAVLLSQKYRVGILDADIYGPSVAFMLGCKSKIEMNSNGFFVPHKSFGVKFVSVGSMLQSDSPAIWRGPMATKLIKDLLVKTNWGDLDYLIIDTPPGTGDIHITLCQDFAIDGVVLVTTAQKVSLCDVKRSFYMFKKLNVGVIGIAENMSYKKGDNDVRQYILGAQKNTDEFVHQTGLDVIARLPISTQISESCDLSIPAVLDLNIASFYTDIVDSVVKKCPCS